MFAAVDLGSNSFRLHIGSHDGEAIRIIKTAREPLRLGAGIDSEGCLTEQAMQNAIACLQRFSETLAAYPLTAVRVVATNTFRIAKNAALFLPLAEHAIGYPIEIISGEEEGRLIYMGVASALAAQNERRLVLDIGGGSTELILGSGAEIERVESFSIGTVKQNLSFFSGGHIDADSFDAAILSARSHFEDAAPPYHPQYWVRAYGSSGTIRAIADAIVKNKFGDGSFSYRNLELFRDRLIEFGHTSQISLVGMKADRATTIVGGLAVLMGLMQELGIDSLTPIEAGVRMGVLWDLQLRATQRDRREQSVLDFSLRFRVNASRANRAADIARALHIMLKPATEIYARYLTWSCVLHEVGLIVSQSGYHKHGAYLIENADLPGFTTREQQIMSTLVLGQKGNLRKLNNALADLDFAKAVLAMRLAVMFMHARIEVDPEQLRLKMKSRIDLEIRRDLVKEHPTISYWIEKEAEVWGEIGVEFAIKTIV